MEEMRDTGENDYEAFPRSLEEISRSMRDKSPNGHRIQPFDDGDLMESLHLANAQYDKNRPGDVESTRKVFGPVSRFFKRVVRRLTAWYFRPAFDNQLLFNAYITRTVNEMKRYVDHLQVNEDILSTIMHRDLALFRTNVLFLNKYLKQRMMDFEKQVMAPEQAARKEGGGQGDPEGLLSKLDVLTLEQRIHGTTRMVKDRARVFVQYLKDCNGVVAIGCGRGELLQLLVQEGINARGTETSPVLVDYCRDHGLDVSREDPLRYLDRQSDNSIEGLVLSRFAGHQPPGRLIRALDLCRQKLKDEAILVIETPNPFSLYAVASYALEDSDHIHPLHPETLKLLCLSYGFVEPAVMFLNPLPPEEHLEELELAQYGTLLDSREQELFHQVNQNFRKINRIIFSHRDYALVARRSQRDLD